MNAITRRGKRARAMAAAVSALALAVGALGATGARAQTATTQPPAAPAPQAAPAEPPKRVLALTPFGANLSMALGVRPIAIGETLGGQRRLMRALTSVPRLTLAHPLGPNLEEAALLNPDLVLSSSVWGKGNAALGELGMRVVDADPATVRALPRAIERVGSLLGRAGPARSVAAVERRRLRFTSGLARRRPTVLLLLGLGRSLQAFTPESWGGSVVAAAGGRLLTRGLPSQSWGFAKISDELVVARDPDVIIVVPHGTRRNIPKIARFLARYPAWKATTAARRGRIHVSTDDTLLQPWLSGASIVRAVQVDYLRNDR